MAAEVREQDNSVNDRLRQEYYRFSFFRAVSLLESLAQGKALIGKTLNPADEPVRFTVKPGFVFPPSDITHLRMGDLAEGPSEMGVAFMGMVGPSGILPDWYNELVNERIKQKDFTLSSFLDIFHHRLISLFYLSWKKYRFEVCRQPGAEDRFSQYMLSLIGLGTEGLVGKAGPPEDTLIFFSGLLSGRTPTVAYIEATIGYFAGVEARVDQLVDRIIPLESSDYSLLGATNGEIGINAICGSETWENQTKFRVNLGSMGYARFVRFLPTGDILRCLFYLIRYMSGIEYVFDIRLFLKREEVVPCRLGGEEKPESPRLGWSTWLKTDGMALLVDPCITFRESDVLTDFSPN